MNTKSLVIMPAARRAILSEAAQRKLDLTPFIKNERLDVEAIADHMVAEDLDGS